MADNPALSTRRAKPGPMLPGLLERIPLDVLAQLRMEAPPEGASPPPAAPPPADPPKPATGDGDLGDAGTKAIEAERAARKEAEKQAKAFQSELDKLRKQTMGETEKAIAEAKDAGRAEARSQYGGLLVAEAYRTLTVGRTMNPEAAITFDRLAFLDDDGAVKRDDLKKWVDDNSTPVGNPRPQGDADLGARGGAPPPANSRQADLLQIEKDINAATRR